MAAQVAVAATISRPSGRVSAASAAAALHAHSHVVLRWARARKPSRAHAITVKLNSAVSRPLVIHVRKVRLPTTTATVSQITAAPAGAPARSRRRWAARITSSTCSMPQARDSAFADCGGWAPNQLHAAHSTAAQAKLE